MDSALLLTSGRGLSGEEEGGRGVESGVLPLEEEEEEMEEKEEDIK